MYFEEWDIIYECKMSILSETYKSNDKVLCGYIIYV